MSRPKLDVLVPARGEAVTLPGSLLALLCDSRGLDLRVIVVANGPDRPATLAAARALAPAYAKRQQALILVESKAEGKAAALNRGDSETRGCCVLYLDADAVILPGTLEALIKGLEGDEPRLVGPPPHLVRPQCLLAASFGAFWSRLPNVEGDVVGGGAYATNPAGRALWGRFPDVAADDLFVRTRFSPGQRRLLESGGFYLELPPGSALVVMKRRWNRGNNELRNVGTISKAALPRQTRVTDLFRLVRSPADLPGLIAFLLIEVWARMGAKSPGASPGWSPHRKGRSRLRLSEPPRILVCVVAHNNRDDLAACLGSLISDWAELSVRVVDNGSVDESFSVARAHGGTAAVSRNSNNIGFAAAVNKLAGQAEQVDYLMLVNPDTILRPRAIDHLVSVMLRYPDAGLVGGRMLTRDGRLDQTSCIAAPSLRQAAAFAICLAFWPGLRWLDPDRLRGWARDDIRAVPVLTGGMLIVDARLWRKLNGFDERFFLYGEDVDLSRRAVQSRARPMFAPGAVYVHKGGASSATPSERMIAIMRGKVTIYRTAFSPKAAVWAGRLLFAGVALRAALERFPVAGRRLSVWRTVWARRADWQDGWTDDMRRKGGAARMRIAPSLISPT